MFILVTGGNGFVGKALIKHLTEVQRHNIVFFPTHKELDLTEYHKVRGFFKRKPSIDLVIHCAVSKPHDMNDEEDWGRKINNDILMATNLMSEAPRMILLTSGSVYPDFGRSSVYGQESASIRPLFQKGTMGWPKAIISTIASNFGNIVELRPFGIYGPGEQSFRFPTYCFNQILDNQPISINHMRKISYIYIDDLVKIIASLAKNYHIWTSRILNVAHPDPYTPLQIAEECVKVVEAKNVVGINKASIQFTGWPALLVGGQGNDYVADTERLKGYVSLNLDLGLWEDFFTPLDVGLSKLYDWLLEQRKQNG